ncbi:MAG: dephospho-CoA kinase [Dongiaceae bacterium]
MKVLGLTGSIGMGKTTVAAALRRLRIPVHDADATVHRLLRTDRVTVAAVEAAFPGVSDGGGGIDRAALSRRVFGDAAALERLERILHPLVRRAELRFLRRAAAARVPMVVLDIPLLFETAAERRCHAVLVVSAPDFVQTARVLHRRGMTPARLAAILARQMPDSEKRRRADFVVPSGLDRRTGWRALSGIVRAMRGGPGVRQRRNGRPARDA